jgi:hypothetical protein
MSTQQLQVRTTARRTDLRRGWWLIAGLLLIATLGAATAYYSAPAATGRTSGFFESSEAGTQGVMNYIRVHESVGDAALPIDPSAPSVTITKQTTPDAATQGILNYIRVHQVIHDYMILGLYHAQSEPTD